MSMMNMVPSLLRNDARLIARNGLLMVMLSMVFVMAVGMRFALPAIDISLAANGVLPNADSPMRFAQTFPLWVVFIGLWQAALMPGTVFGFLLLDEKEDQTLTAMRVSPVPMPMYVTYRLALPYILAVIFSLAVVPIMGIDVLPWVQRVPLALSAALVAPLTTVSIATFAADKVQGLAFTKFTGIAGLLIIGGWFVGGSWQWAFGVFPPFLVAKAYWMALAGDSMWWLAALVGMLVQGVALWGLVRRFALRGGV